MISPLLFHPDLSHYKVARKTITCQNSRDNKDRFYQNYMNTGKVEAELKKKKKHIQCDAVIMRSIVTPLLTKDTP